MVTISHLVHYENLLQNVTKVYLKMRQAFYYKVRQFYQKMFQLLKNATFIANASLHYLFFLWKNFNRPISVKLINTMISFILKLSFTFNHIFHILLKSNGEKVKEGLVALGLFLGISY